VRWYGVERVTLGWCAAFVVLAVGLGGAVPFVPFPMFVFKLPERPTVIPLFKADGVPSSEEGFERFSGVAPSAVDLAHRGYECSAEHMMHELEEWLRWHQAAPGEPDGPVVVEVGLRILEIGPDGRVTTTERIDARGRAWPAAR
jgi:hypothetical protein